MSFTEDELRQLREWDSKVEQEDKPRKVLRFTEPPPEPPPDPILAELDFMEPTDEDLRAIEQEDDY